jgi:hypothetical protein
MKGVEQASIIMIPYSENTAETYIYMATIAVPRNVSAQPWLKLDFAG